MFLRSCEYVLTLLFRASCVVCVSLDVVLVVKRVVFTRIILNKNARREFYNNVFLLFTIL